MKPEDMNLKKQANELSEDELGDVAGGRIEALPFRQGMNMQANTMQFQQGMNLGASTLENAQVPFFGQSAGNAQANPKKAQGNPGGQVHSL